MKIMIFTRDEERTADLYGKAVLSPIETMGINGEMSFSLTYPLEEEDHKELMQGYYVVIPDFDDPSQFHAYEIINRSEDLRNVTIDCEHRYIGDLGGGMLKTFTTESALPEEAMLLALEGERWEIGIVQGKRRLSRSVKDMNPLAALRFIEKEWGGELRFRITMKQGQFDRFYVDLLERLGEYNGVRFELGHNLIDFKHNIDFSGVVTAMYGRGVIEQQTPIEEPELPEDPPIEDPPIEEEPMEMMEEGEGQEEEKEKLTFAEIEWKVSKGDPVDKPLGQDWVGDEEARLLYGRPDGKGGRQHIFGVWDSQAKTQLGLLQETWLKVRENREPLLNIEANVFPLSQYGVNFHYERVKLGDDVLLIVRHKNQNIAVMGRILKISRDRKNWKNTVFEIGNYLPMSMSNRLQSIEADANKVKERQSVWNRAEIITPGGKVPTSVLDGILDTVRNKIISSLGHVYQDEKGITILNAAEDKNPTKALRLGGGVLAIANRKTAAGEWDWRTFGDGDGFVADELTSGKLQTDLIEILGSAYFRWNGENIYIINPEDTKKQIRIGNFRGKEYGIGFTKDGGATWNVALDFNGLKININNVDGLEDFVNFRITTYTDSEINKIKFGARNLVTNSTFNYGQENWNNGQDFPAYASIIEPELDKPKMHILKFDNAGNAKNLFITSDPIKREDKEYTLAFEIRIEDLAELPGDCNLFRIESFGAADNELMKWGSVPIAAWQQVINTEVERYYITKKDLIDQGLQPGAWFRAVLTVPVDSGAYIRVYPSQSAGTSLVWFRGIQLTEGNKTSTWTPAIEDGYKDINLTAERLTTVEQQINPDNITQTVMEHVTFTDLLGNYATNDVLGEYASLAELEQSIKGLQDEIKEKIDGIDYTPFVQGSEFREFKDRMNMNFLAAGGVNILKNSLGFADFNFWGTHYGSEIQIVGSQAFEPYQYGSGFYFPRSVVGRYMDQEVTFIAGKTYTLSWLVKKINQTSGTGGALAFQIYQVGGRELLSKWYSSEALTDGWEINFLNFTPEDTQTYLIRVYGESYLEAYVTALMLNEGETPFQWTTHPTELYNGNIKFDVNGIQVIQRDENGVTGYTSMSPDGFEGYIKRVNANGQEYYERIFMLREDETVSKKVRAIDEISMGPIKVVKSEGTGFSGWSFVPIVNVGDILE